MNRGWLVGVATTVGLGFAGWVAVGAMDHESRLSVVETREQVHKEWMERLERKLDAALAALTR